MQIIQLNKVNVIIYTSTNVETYATTCGASVVAATTFLAASCCWYFLIVASSFLASSFVLKWFLTGSMRVLIAEARAGFKSPGWRDPSRYAASSASTVVNVLRREIDMIEIGRRRTGKQIQRQNFFVFAQTSINMSWFRCTPSVVIIIQNIE